MTCDLEARVRAAEAAQPADETPDMAFPRADVLAAGVVAWIVVGWVVQMVWRVL